MKTINILSAILLLSLLTGSASAASKATGKSKYFVQVPHTQEQCMNMLGEMKKKGDPFLSKFYFGCMNGDHTGYGVLEGSSEDDVRKMLPREEQANAKIEKVDQFTAAKIEQIHKQHAEKK
jgi:hypothetical protein